MGEQPLVTYSVNTVWGAGCFEDGFFGTRCAESLETPGHGAPPTPPGRISSD